MNNMKQKNTFLILALLCAIVQGTKAQITFPIVYDDVWDGRTTSVPVYYTEYKGHTNVVVIKKASELAYIRDNWREKATYSENTNPYSNLNYYLDANLDLGDAVSWNPIGKGWLDGLTKTFYGANHTIRINIQHEGEEDAGGGLFSRLGAEGVIQDLHVTGIINVGDWRCIGAIVGANQGKIKNCWVSADVISAHYSASNSAALGGIAGQCYGSSSVEYCCMTGNVSNPKNNGVAGIIGEGYGNANHVTFYGTRYNDHSEHDIWVGEQDGTLTNQHADDLNNDATLTSYLGSFSGNDLYRQAIQYSYAVNIKNIGTGIMTSNLERTRPGQTVRLTKASGNSVASVTVKDADSNPITVSGNEMNGWTFTMPQRDVTVTAAFLNDDGTVPDTGMSIDVWNGSSQARPGYFDASSHTIHIQSAAQLIYVYNNWDNEVFSGYDYYECNYILDTDLDMSTKTWKPLGSKAYKGTFNGNGHMIRIKIDDSSISDNGQGLFATIASGSRVENLHVDGKIKVGNARLVGGIAGDNYGTIRNCWVSANVESSHYSSYDADLGGICGLNESDGTVEFCCMTGNVTNTGDNSGVGGLAGSNDGTIQHCTFYGSVSVNHSQDNKYVGEQDETMEDMYDTYDDVHYGYSNGGGNNMYCYAYKYPYSVTVNTMGTGTIRTSAADEYDVPGTYPDATFTLHVTSGSVARFTITNADGNDVPLQGQANDGSSYWFVMPQKNITATFVFYEDWPTQGTGTEEDPYLISSADDWNKFAHNVTYGRNYSGQYVKLTNDISVTTMAGGYQTDDNYQPFSGTFDGDGHTLTFNKSGWTEKFIAPFRYVGGTCTIKNLKTAGSITSSGMYPTGLIAGTKDGSTITVENCVSSMSLNCTGSGDKTNCGFVGRIENVTLNIRGCAFNGSFSGGSTTNTGFVAWIAPGSTVTIEDCLFDPSSIGTNSGTCATFARKDNSASAPTITNCYYTQTLGTAQGIPVQVASEGYLGNLLHDYGMVKAYDYGIFYNGTAYFAVADIAGTGTEEDPYLISSADDWNKFAHNVTYGISFSGKVIKLTNDISVSSMAGSYQTDDNYQPFSGTFDGDGHTLTLNVSKQGRFAAPFKCVKDATIKNLHTAGTIDGTGNADGKLLAGIIGVSFGNTTITGCRSSVTLTTDFGEDAALAGLVAGTKGGSLTIEGCVFDGSMTGASNTRCAGIVGYEYGGTTTTISNCLFIPATLTVSTADDSYTKTISRDADATITNCYYTQALGTAQGTQAIAVTTAPADLGSLVEDYGLVKAYQHGILFDGLYYVDPNALPYKLLSEATAEDIGKVVCAYGHLHDAKTAVPTGCTAVGILGKVTETGIGLILALQDATSQTWFTINGWTSVTTYAGTTLKVLPAAARGSLTSYTTLGTTAVSNWAVAQKSDYEAIFTNLGSTTGGSNGKTYDANVNDYITTGVGGTAISDLYWSATESSSDLSAWYFDSNIIGKTTLRTIALSVRPVLGFTFIASELPGTGTAGDPYTISNSDEWRSLASHVNNGNNFSGKYVKLMDDIAVTNKCGTVSGSTQLNPFSGTFLGNNKTITVTFTDDGSQGIAPFRYINGATIKDLKVAGTIASSQNHSAGLVGFANGTNLIENCLVTATLNVSSNYAGGIIGHGLTSATTIRGCAFTGTINGVGGNRENIGGIWGWSDTATPTLENCLEAGTYNANIASMHPMGLQGTTGTITNCYYLNAQTGSPRNVCTVSGAKQAYTAATTPANLGSLVEDYGTLTAYENGILYDGTYFVAPATVILADNADNNTSISNANGYVADVTLAGRTLYKDGAWNTLCLPFSVDNFTGTPLEGTTVKTLASTGFSGGTLTMTFSEDVTSIEAGKPYIVKWAEGTDIANPVFNGVTISDAPANAETDYVDFVGTYSPVGIYTADRTKLFLGSANMLRYPTNPNYTVNAFRGYFQLKNGLTASENASQVSGNEVKAFVLNFGDGETTGIESLTPNPSPNGEGSEYWYSIDGRRLQGEPTQKGVYIRNGKKIMK